MCYIIVFENLRFHPSTRKRGASVLKNLHYGARFWMNALSATIFTEYVSTVDQSGEKISVFKQKPIRLDGTTVKKNKRCDKTNDAYCHGNLGQKVRQTVISTLCIESRYFWRQLAIKLHWTLRRNAVLRAITHTQVVAFSYNEIAWWLVENTIICNCQLKRDWLIHSI